MLGLIPRLQSLSSSLLRSLDSATGRILGSQLPDPRAPDPFLGLLPFELTSKQALTIPREGSSASDAASPNPAPSAALPGAHALAPPTPLEGSGAPDPAPFDALYGRQVLEFAGVCSLPSAVPNPALLGACASAADRLVSSVYSLVAAEGVDPLRPEGFSFLGAHQRDPGRLDVRNHHCMDEAPFDAPELGEGAAWMPIVQATLGRDAHLIWKGVVVTDPGAGDQAWHPDGPDVPRDVWDAVTRAQSEPPPGPGTLPPHCLTVFVPLVPLTPEAGPTCFLPGTQHAATMAALKQEADEAGSSGGAGVPATLETALGDATVFDIRVRHRGSANKSGARRPVLYMVYGRKWFGVGMHRRLLEESGQARVGKEPPRLFRLRGDPK